MLKLDVVREAQEWTVVIVGRIDAITTAELEKELLSIPEEVKKVTLDFEKVEYISSAGLRSLVQAENYLRKHDGTMQIIHAPQVILEIFEVTGFSEFLPVNQ